MKITLRIPTADQYAFVEVVLEDFQQLPSAETIKEEYDKYIRAFRVNEGVDEKTFNTFIDNQLLGNGKNSVEVYNLLSEPQKAIVQALKRGLKRITPKEE